MFALKSRAVVMRHGFLSLALLFSFVQMSAQQRTSPQSQQKELGKVSWYRDYDSALARAQKAQKPVLILFQEVPGCATCVGFGDNVLRHPLMVEAIENLFVPLVIFNNRGGKDREILQHYGEPSWNNPVVRIVDAQGNNIIQRHAGDYSPTGLYTAMEAALNRVRRPIPAYMQLLGEELGAAHDGDVREDYFSMYCFWSGESHLGAAPGVLATEPGFMRGHEVVRVRYNAKVIDAAQLRAHAAEANCTPIAQAKGYRIDKDPQYYLKHSDFRFLPLTRLQRTRINAALGHRQSGTQYLSPKQLAWLKGIRDADAERAAVYDRPFVAAWWGMR